MLTREELLVAYDTQLRARVPDRLPAGVEVEHDGPLVRLLGLRTEASSATPISPDSTGPSSRR